MRGVRSTAVLVVLLAGLVGYIYFVETDREPGGAASKDKVFASLTADDVEDIQLKANGSTSRLHKTDGTWRIVEPVVADADQNEMSSMVSSLATMDIQQVVNENVTDFKQYGLETPPVEVTFRVKGQKDPRRLWLGEKTPTAGDIYARLPGSNRVFLVSSFLDSTFNKDTFALRDKTVLRFERDKVDHLELVDGAATLEFAKTGMDWRIVKPIAARADFGGVEGVIERLSSAQMQGLVEPADPDLKTYGLNPPSSTFAVTVGSSRAALLLGKTENAVVYAKDASRPLIFTVAPTLKDDLLKNVSEYRRKDIFDARSFTIDRIELRRGTDTYAFERTKSGEKATWRNAAGKDADAAAVEDLLTKITSLRAQSFESVPHPSLKSPVLVVTARFEGKTETVTFGRAGDEVFASRADEPGAAKLETMPFDEAMKALEAAR